MYTDQDEEREVLALVDDWLSTTPEIFGDDDPLAEFDCCDDHDGPCIAFPCCTDCPYAKDNL